MEENIDKRKNKFLIVGIACLVLMLFLGYFGINSGLKGTSAAGEYKCDSGYTLVSGTTYCCRDGYSYWGEYKGSYYCYPSGTNIQSYNSAKVRMVTATLNGDYEGDYDALNKACTDQYPGSVRHTSGMALSDGTTIVTCRQELNYFGELVKNAVAASTTACYKCASGYYWTSSPFASCTVVSEIQDEASCEAAGDAAEEASKVCYYCNTKVSGEHYHWAVDGDTALEDYGCVKETGISYESTCLAKNGNVVYTITYNTGTSANNDTSADVPASATLGASSTSASVTQGSSITLPTVTATGYTFDGWYTALVNGVKRGGAGDSYTPTKSETLYAQWTNVSGGSDDESNTDTDTDVNIGVATGEDSGSTGVATGEDSGSSGETTEQKIGNTCGQTNFGAWTKSSCNAYPGYQEGKCYLWNSSNNCCDIKNYVCSGTSGDGNDSGNNGSSGDADNSVNVGDSDSDENNVNSGSNENSGNNENSGSNENSGNEDSGNDGNNGNDDNTGSSEVSNPQTGEAAIVLVLIIGLFAIGYSVWYFKKLRINNEN